MIDRWLRLGVCVVGLLCGGAFAQEGAQVRARYEMTTPPGCEILNVEGMKAICPTADKALVESALKGAGPTSRPTTMPTDLISRLGEHREALAKKMARDFDLADTKGIAKDLDELAAALQKLDQFQPPIFFLCIRADQLKTMLKESAWTNPSLYYNRLMDEVTYRERVSLTTDRPMDDTVVAVIRDPQDQDEAYSAKIQKLARGTRDEVARMIAGRSMYLTQVTLMDSAMRNAFADLKLNEAQQWLAVGIAGAMSAEYSEPILGSPRKEQLLLIAAELRQNPIRTRTIDLLHPADAKSIKRAYVPLYSDAYRRKSIAVCAKLIDKAHEKIPELIKSLRTKPCATGDDLIRRIRETMGVDLSADVAAK